MNQNVKEFIEQNIDLIEEHNWTALFDTWYTRYYMFDKIAADDFQLLELFAILQEIGILPNEHRTAREELLIKYFNEYIDESIFENAKTITAVGAINSLHSWLGMPLIGLKAQFVDMCKQRGFEQLQDPTKGRFKLP